MFHISSSGRTCQDGDSALQVSKYSPCIGSIDQLLQPQATRVICCVQGVELGRHAPNPADASKGMRKSESKTVAVSTLQVNSAQGAAIRSNHKVNHPHHTDPQTTIILCTRYTASAFVENKCDGASAIVPFGPVLW